MRVFIMKKTYGIEVDCANCALKMEEAAKKTSGVKDATVSFMTQKMKVEFEDGAKRLNQIVRFFYKLNLIDMKGCGLYD